MPFVCRVAELLLRAYPRLFTAILLEAESAHIASVVREKAQTKAR